MNIMTTTPTHACNVISREIVNTVFDNVTISDLCNKKLAPLAFFIHVIKRPWAFMIDSWFCFYNQIAVSVGRNLSPHHPQQTNLIRALILRTTENLSPIPMIMSTKLLI